MIADLRYAWRLLAKSPVTSLLALAALALAIGGVTAVFSVVNAALLRPYPHIEVERWGYVYETSQSGGLQQISASIPNFRDWRDQSQSFEGLFLWQPWTFNVSGSAEIEPERVEVAIITGEVFQALGVQPIAGRLLRPSEETQLPERGVVISHGLWQRRFGGDPNIAGRKIELNLVPHTVLGVTPSGFVFPAESRVEVWVPFGARAIQSSTGRDGRGFSVAAKLRRGVSFEKAQAELNTIASRLAAQYPEDRGFGVQLVPLREAVAGDIREPLLLMLGALGLVLLLACVNVASLQIARIESRRKELAMRVALGCGRLRLARYVLAEIVLLTGGGALLGVCLAPLLVNWLLSAAPARETRWLQVTPDWVVFAAATAVTILAALIAGGLPAWRGSQTSVRGLLVAGGSTATSAGSAVGLWMRRVFVAGQIALSLMPLVAAALLVQSFVHMQSQRPGFEPEHRTTLSFMAPRARYPNPETIALLADRVREAVAHAPGVRSAGLGQTLPFAEGIGWFQAVTRQDPRSIQNLAGLPHVHYNVASAGYAEALGIPMKAGRDLNRSDTAAGQPVVLINETLARRFFPGEDPIGKPMWVGHAQALPEQQPRIVVGVMGDVLWSNLTAPAQPAAWVPIGQQSFGVDAFRNLFVAVHAVGDPKTVIAGIREQMKTADRDLALTNIQTLETRVSESMWRHRLAASAMTALSLLALAIALMGVFGTISYLVNRRLHEMGIRLALGATRGGIVRLVTGEGTWLVFAGLVAGGVGAYALSGYLSSLLFGVTAVDAKTFFAASVGLGLAAVLACYLPARRAAAVDPATLLR
jgi:putative ABC transport system permease protein